MNFLTLSLADLLSIKNELVMTNRLHEQRKKDVDGNTQAYIDRLVRDNNKTLTAIKSEIDGRLSSHGIKIL